MAPNLILFAGAPPASSVTIESCTLDTIDEKFWGFLGVNGESSQQKHVQSPSSQISWRSLSLQKQPLHSSFNQAHDMTNYSLPNQAEFFTTANVSFTSNGESFDSESGPDVLSQFCDHSLAMHNPLPSSLLDSFDETSMIDISTATTSFMGQQQGGAQEFVVSDISDLKDIPPARQILSLNPQTVTLNLVVGIISIAQPRTITTRWGTTLSLVEILVGDGTKSGFAVTFWLPRDDGGDAPESQAVLSLRRQDVVLMQNVALHVFQGKVHGQSLRRNMTKVRLLWRRDGSGYYSGRDLMKKRNVSHQVHKTRSVKDWVLRFVGGDAGPRTRKTRKSWDRPPEDSQ